MRYKADEKRSFKSGFYLLLIKPKHIARGLSGTDRAFEASSVQERLRAILSQYGPELARVRMKFII